jgi:hypothetical protein
MTIYKSKVAFPKLQFWESLYIIQILSEYIKNNEFLKKSQAEYCRGKTFTDYSEKRCLAPNLQINFYREKRCLAPFFGRQSNLVPGTIFRLTSAFTLKSWETVKKT